MTEAQSSLVRSLKSPSPTFDRSWTQAGEKRKSVEMCTNSYDAWHYDDKLKCEAEDSLKCQIVAGLLNVSGSALLQWMKWASHAIQNTVRVRTHGQRSHGIQSKQRRAVNHCFSTRMCNTRWKNSHKKLKKEKREEKEREKRESRITCMHKTNQSECGFDASNDFNQSFKWRIPRF